MVVVSVGLDGGEEREGGGDGGRRRDRGWVHGGVDSEKSKLDLRWIEIRDITEIVK